MTKNRDILNKLYEEAKAKRIVLNQTEFARALGKSRVTVFDRMMKSLEGIPQEVIDKALKLMNDTPFVSRETKKEPDSNESNPLVLALRALIREQDNLRYEQETVIAFSLYKRDLGLTADIKNINAKSRKI